MGFYLIAVYGRCDHFDIVETALRDDLCNDLSARPSPRDTDALDDVLIVFLPIGRAVYNFESSGRNGTIPY